MKPTKALKIDSKARTVTEVTIGDLKEIQEAVGGYICVGFRLANGDTCYVDDEGMMKDPEHFFRVPGARRDEMYLAGNGVLFGRASPAGNETNVKTTAEKLRQVIQFATAPFTDFPPEPIHEKPKNN